MSHTIDERFGDNGILTDYAAAVAEVAWDQTPAGQMITQLLHALEQRPIAHEDGSPCPTAVATASLTSAAVRTGARLGFALAHATDTSAQGTRAWLEAATEWLEETDCSIQDHLEPTVDHLRQLLGALLTTD